MPQMSSHQPNNQTQVPPSGIVADPILVSVVAVLAVPLVAALAIALRRRHRAARLQRQIAKLERLWHLSPRR